MASLKFIKKLDAVVGGSRLELSVTKKLGPVSTTAEVGSSGTDDRSFSDSQLTPGPATMPMDPANVYAIVWRVAFTRDGSATLKVRVVDAQGNVLTNKNITVKGKANQVQFRAIVVP